MHESGLLQHWINTYQPKPYKCMEMAKSQGDRKNQAKISLKNLGLSFWMLLLGFILSFIVLVYEKLMFVCTFIRILGQLFKSL